MPHAESPPAPPPFAELYCRSCFSFLTGASHPDELLTRAASLGYTALAITDECSMAGMVRAYAAWQQQQGAIQLIVGTRLQLADGPGLVLLATDRASYGRLSSLITRGRRAAEKGSYHLTRADFDGGLPGCLALLLPHEGTACDPQQLAQALHTVVSQPPDSAHRQQARQAVLRCSAPAACGHVLFKTPQVIHFAGSQVSARFFRCEDAKRLSALLRLLC